MNICIQTDVVKKERDLDNVVLSLRLRGAEAARFWRLMDKAKAKNAYIDRSDVLREMLGLDPLNILTDKELDIFRHGKELSPSAKTPLLHKKDEVITQAKRRTR
jgi:hypothetical protein